MNVVTGLNKANDWFGKMTGKAGRSIMKGNEAINSIGAMSGEGVKVLDNIGSFSGLSRTIGMIGHEGPVGVNSANKKLLEKVVGGEIKGASVELSMFEKAKLAHMDSSGNYKLGRIAGSVAVGGGGLSVAGRIAGGGGVYKDGSGNANLIGVPFV